MPKSTIDHLLDRVDWRCTRCNTPVRDGCHCWDKISEEEKTRCAADVRAHVREYIRYMYPEVWRAMPQRARTSILNCIYNAVHTSLGTLNPTFQEWPGDTY